MNVVVDRSADCGRLTSCWGGVITCLLGRPVAGSFEARDDYALHGGVVVGIAPGENVLGQTIGHAFLHHYRYPHGSEIHLASFYEIIHCFTMSPAGCLRPSCCRGSDRGSSYHFFTMWPGTKIIGGIYISPRAGTLIREFVGGCCGPEGSGRVVYSAAWLTASTICCAVRYTSEVSTAITSPVRMLITAENGVNG